MIRLYYSDETKEMICSHEEYTLKLYKKKINNYLSQFVEKGYSYEVGLFWDNFYSGNGSKQRCKFGNGYTCYVYFDVLQDGKIVCLEGDDEADYYPLSVCWEITCIRRWFFKLRVELFDDVDDDLESDIKEMLSQIASR